MKEIRNGEFDARGNPLIRHDLRFDVAPASLSETEKGEKSSSALQETEVMRLDRILQKMKKAEQKKWFHGKEKKELKQKITGK